MLVKAVDSPAGGNNHALSLTITHNHAVNGKGCILKSCQLFEYSGLAISVCGYASDTFWNGVVI